MADIRQQLIGARRALLILGWALVIAKVALAIESNVRTKLSASPLAERVQSFDDDTIAGFVNAPERDARGRAGFASDQMIVRFRDRVSDERCREILSIQRTRSLRLLDPDRNLYLAELTPPLDVARAINQFVVLSEVDYAVPNVYWYTY